ncbi:MAG: glycoside hydrolase family 27 protein [Eubacterium sp.]|nr:glycoside hydrolase family 27 protein [Eubacterium sp.]
MDKSYFDKPVKIEDSSYRADAFKNGKVLYGKKHLPAMGWNSWNAFGSGNTEALTKAMADKMIELGLDKLGYQYIVLDDGCYGAARVDGHLVSDEVKFPSGFMAMSDYIHGKGLKFGMYNDIGSRLCSGLEVGTCGYEDVDTEDYIGWGVDYIKVDNCYNVWDNATFSNPENARFTFAPGIKGIVLSNGQNKIEKTAVGDGIITGSRAYIEGDYVMGIGTFDGTGPDATPVGDMSSELQFKVTTEAAGEYDLTVACKTGAAEGIGSWLQVAVGEGEGSEIFYDDLVDASETGGMVVKIKLAAGENLIRLMNHRRQENTLTSYARIQEGFKKTGSDRDIIFSICEWGKTQPQNWGYKVGDSWRILNDITFQVGSDGDSGHAAWEGAYTTSVTAQYNKAVIMDEFAGPDKGWNDPDMLMIGMDGLTETMNKTHMTMWCMINSPLMLGMDLRNVSAGDAVYNIITNEDVIALNQDGLGVQAKRIFTTKAVAPDTTYIRDNDRMDVLAKPLDDGSVALSFINVGMGDRQGEVSIKPSLIMDYISDKMIDPDSFANAERYEVKDLWSKEKKIYDAKEINEKGFTVSDVKANDNVTLRITPIYD